MTETYHVRLFETESIIRKKKTLVFVNSFLGTNWLKYVLLISIYYDGYGDVMW